MCDLPSIQQGRNNLLWCGDTFLRSDRGSFAHTEARDSPRGSALHSCHHTVKSQSVRHITCVCLQFLHEQRNHRQTTNGTQTFPLTGILTKPLNTPLHRCTLLSHGCRWHRWDTGREVGMLYRSIRTRKAPHNAIPGTHQCRHRHLWWGYTWPHSGTGSDYCNEVPSSRSHSLQAHRDKTSGWAREQKRGMCTRIYPWKCLQ